MTTTNSHTPLTAAQAAALLDLLQNDDAFRSSFAANPTQALAGLGVVANPDGDCCIPVESLASKEDFASVSAALQARVVVDGAFSVPYYFEAGKIEEALGS